MATRALKFCTMKKALGWFLILVGVFLILDFLMAGPRGFDFKWMAVVGGVIAGSLSVFSGASFVRESNKR